MKRFKISEKIIVIIFVISLYFYIFNKDFLYSFFSEKISGYFFWLSLGLFLGFQLCKYELIRVLKKDSEDQSKLHRQN